MGSETKKAWYASKTIWINVLTTVAGLAAYGDFLPLSDEAKAALLAASGIANVLLRFITKQPIGS